MGPTSCKFKFSWPLAKSGSPFSEVFWDQNLANLNFLGLWPRVDACFLRFLGTKSYKLKFSWPLAESGCLFPKFVWTKIFIFIYHHVGITKVQLFGLAALHRRLLWGSVKDNFGPKMHIFLQSQANFGRFFADQPTGQESKPVFCGIGVQKRVVYVSPR